MQEWYLPIKALHIIFFTSWFAGLFYLPRIYVNLAMVSEPSAYDHLLIMAKKLYRFITPFMFITIGLGLWLLHLVPGWLSALWMQIKLALVIILVIYHFICGKHLSIFIQKNNTRSHVFYRWFNEFPVLVLFAIVFLAVTKPL